MKYTLNIFSESPIFIKSSQEYFDICEDRVHGGEEKNRIMIKKNFLTYFECILRKFLEIIYHLQSIQTFRNLF